MKLSKVYSVFLPIALLSVPAVAQNPYLQPDDTWINLSGTVESVSRDQFELNYGKGTVTVEMDDGDRDADAYKLIKGDEVTVTGLIDDDFYEMTTIEASSVHVESIDTTFYASAVDEEDSVAIYAYHPPEMNVVVGDIVVTGTVSGLDMAEEEFTLNTGARLMTVEVDEMAYNPIDDEGYQQLESGDVVSVRGQVDFDLFEGRVFEADTVTTLWHDISQAQHKKQGQGPSERIITSDAMDQQELYKNGISIENLLGGDVVDSSGKAVGEVEDFVIGADSNRVVGLVVETGGFLNIGDNHLLYSFDQANIRGESEVQADISSSTVKDLSLFREIEGQSLKKGKSRATEIIGGLAYSDGEPYGHIDDLIVNSSGNILAVVVQADVMYDDNALYAWPYAGFNDDVYDVPADERYAFGQEPLDYDQLQGAKAASQ